MNNVESSVVRTENGSQAADRTPKRRVALPDVDVFENADEVLVVADLPGVASDAVDVRVENETLTLVAKRATPADAGPALGREYEEVDYTRSFRIPAGIDTANVQAEARNGTVLLHLPKVAAIKPRKVAVRAS
jgi:HSP20 family protein